VGPDLYRPKALYREDGELINRLPDSFYSSRHYTDKMLAYIDSNIDDGKPFFGYLAYTAPHWPLQVPDEYLSKYRGRYKEGYDALRQQRFNKMKEKGLIDKDAVLPPRPESVLPWEDLTEAQQLSHARNMEIYAAMVEYMDMSIGRVLAYLKQQGQYENTLVLFMSDNGADHWSLSNAPPPVADFANSFDQTLEMRGRKGSFTFYGTEWAHVSEGPLRMYKGFTTEGGVRAPAILSWPGMEVNPKQVAARTTVTDVLPTFLEAAASEREPGYYIRRDKLVPTGKSLLPLLMGQAVKVHDEHSGFGLEIWGHRALYLGDWKLLYVNQQKSTGNWQLFNIKNDPSERDDLARSEPEKLAELKAMWGKYVTENNVILPQGELKVRPPPPPPEY
jgi:arylsulfatase